MQPTQTLMEEHRVIEQVLDCLDRMAEQCANGQRLDTQSAAQALDFFREFADHCHHAKEEDLLFPLLERKGFSREHGPTGVMLREHVLGRRHVAAMAEALTRATAGNPAAESDFVSHARAYSQLLRQHIAKEDHCLFPMADSSLSDTDQQTLSESFEKVENEQLGDIHATYVHLANQLADRFGVARANSALQQHRGCDSHAL